VATQHPQRWLAWVKFKNAVTSLNFLFHFTLTFYKKYFPQKAIHTFSYAVCVSTIIKSKKNKNTFMKQFKKLFFVTATILFANATFAQMEQTKMVGGAAMYPSKNIVENAVNSKDHTTLVAAVKAAGLVETLQSAGPFTVFAPTNKAFEILPAGTVDNLLKPESKTALTGVLTYHVISGKYTSIDLGKLIKTGKGTATLKTVAGGNLMVMMQGKKIAIKDENGGVAFVTIKDVNQSNGVIHVIDHVVLPKM
jgi:uncharacterized surface protein with fasciclin (FAS1) repeats